MDHRLQDLLGAPALDGRLLDALRPRLSSRAILSPGGYGALLEETRETLHALAATAGPGRDHETMAAAAGVLEEGRELRELLAMYRNVLHKA